MQFFANPETNLHFQRFPGEVGPKADVSPNPTLPPSAGALPVASTIGQEASGSSVKAPYHSVAEFGAWLQAHDPDVYNAVLVSMPGAFVPELYLMGLGEETIAPGETSGVPAPATSWGQDIVSILEQVLPPLAQYQGQRDLIKANIALAEKGQPLISSQDLAPQLNVGVSKEGEKIAYLAIGAAALIGVLWVIKKK